MEKAAAVDARAVGLETPVPLRHVAVASFLLGQPGRSRAAVIRRVVCLATRLAPRLMPEPRLWNSDKGLA